MNRLERDSIDAALHLLDRQVIDADGMMVCNVDDLEITDTGDGTLAVTGLLAGGAALFPRFNGRFGKALTRTWHRLGSQYAYRDTPTRLGLGLMAELGSAITLRVSGEGLLDLQPPPPDGTTHRRLSRFLGMPVLDGDAAPCGRVLDVRLEPEGEEYVLHQILVGRGRPGSLLGYDRGNVNGPWLLNATVSWLHRHTGQVPWSRVASVDWRDGCVRINGGLDPLESS